MRWAALGLGGGLAALAATGGCSSSSDPYAACADPSGTYELTLAPTGQSGTTNGLCLTPGVQAIDITIDGSTVMLGDEQCLLCSTSACGMQIVCGAIVDCGGATVPVADASSTYVENASFVLPTSSAPATSNAFAEIGPAFCGYEGTASRKQ